MKTNNFGFIPDEVESSRSYNDDELDRFLYGVSGPETQYGKNLKHEEITSGPNIGQTAIGQYGILPETVKEFARRSGDKSLMYLTDMTWDEITQEMQNPEIERKIARTGARHVLTNNPDPASAAIAWRKGHNLSGNTISKLLKNDTKEKYAEKFLKGYNKTLEGRDLAKSNNVDSISSNNFGFIKDSPELTNQVSKIEAPPVQPEPEYSELESGGLGALESGTLGFYDEGAGAIKALGSKLTGDTKDLKELYKQYRDIERKRFEDAQKANPKSYIAGNLAGGIASSFIPGLNIAKGATLGKAALQGAKLGIIGGYGASNSDTIAGDIEAASLGGAIGGLAGYGGQVISKALTPAATEARAIKSAVRSVGGKTLPENMRAGKALLQEKTLPWTGGIEGIEQSITSKIDDIEKGPIKRTFDKLSQNTSLPGVMEQKGSIGDAFKIAAKNFAKNIGTDDRKVLSRKISKSALEYADMIDKAKGDPRILNEIRKKIDFQADALGAFELDPTLKGMAPYYREMSSFLNKQLRDIASKTSTGAGETLKKEMARQSPLIAAQELAKKQIVKEAVPQSFKGLNLSTTGLFGAAAYLHNPLLGAAAAGKAALEYGTGHPISRLSNIAAAKSQYALANTGVGKAILKTGEVGTKGAGRILSTTGVQSGIQNFYNTPNAKLKEIADSFSQSPATQNIGQALNRAIESGDDEAKNKVLFAAEQNPAHRARFRELLAVQEETSNPITSPFDDTGFDDET